MTGVDPSSPVKRCARCKVVKPWSEYSMRNTGRPQAYCKPCAVARSAAWAADNPERARDKQRELRGRHPERYARYQREWYEANKEQADAATRRWRATPAGRRSARATARRAFDRKREWLDGFKVGQKCVDCKRKYPPYVLDFDHVRGEKAFTLGNWMAGKVKATEEEVLAEIAKCELRCANCHRIRHNSGLRVAVAPWRQGSLL